MGGADFGGNQDYGDEEMGEEGEGEGDDPLAQYNLDPSVMQAIHTLVSNPSFPMIRERMI
jgi:hypothetical protein